MKKEEKRGEKGETSERFDRTQRGKKRSSDYLQPSGGRQAILKFGSCEMRGG